MFSTIFRMQEAGEVTDQPSTSQQGARGVLSHQGARSVIDQQEEEEEEEEWESVARPPFTYQSPYVLEKLKRVKEAAMEVEYLPYTPGNRSHNRRVKARVNKALQKKRIDRINREGFKKEM